MSGYPCFDPAIDKMAAGGDSLETTYKRGGMISNFPFVVDEGSKEHYRNFFKSGFYKGKLTIGEIASKDIYNFTIWSTTSSTQVKLCMLIGNSKSHCFSILNISENKCFFSRCIVT